MSDGPRDATRIKELAKTITDISDDKRIVSAVEQIVTIAEEMDARTGTIDPSVKARRKGIGGKA